MAHKGRTWFKLAIKGITAYASTPWKDTNAIAGAAEAITSIRNQVMALPKDAELGSATIIFGEIKGGKSALCHT